MVTETLTDYKTVEEERKVTYCDMDGCTGSSETHEMITVAVNPRVETITEWDIIETLDTEPEIREASELIQRKKMDQAARTMEQKAMAGREKPIEKNATATADICTSCVSQVFDIDVPSYKIEDIDFNTDGIRVHTTEEVVRNYPTLDVSNRRNYSLWVVGLTVMVGAPAFFGFGMLDLMDGLYVDETIRKDEIIFSMLGMMAWGFAAGVFLL